MSYQCSMNLTRAHYRQFLSFCNSRSEETTGRRRRGLQSQRRIIPSEVPVASAFSKHWSPPMKAASGTSRRAVELKLALLQSVPALLPVPQLASCGFVDCAMTVRTSIVCTHFPEFKSHTRIVLSAEPLTSVPPMKCSAVISPIWESKMSTQQSATEV